MVVCLSSFHEVNDKDVAGGFAGEGEAMVNDVKPERSWDGSDERKD